MPTKINENQPSKTSQYKEPGDPRQNPNANKYGFQDMMVTRSGHTFIMNDVKDHEYVSLQHRSGTGWIYNPDGSAKMTVFNGFYNDIRGEYRINTSGTFDVRSEVDASFRAEGNFDVTAKQMNTSTHDSYNEVVGSNKNSMVAGKTNIISGEGFQIFGAGGSPVDMTSSEGPINIQGANATLQAKSPAGGLATVGGAQVGIKAEQSDVAIGAKSTISISTEGGDIRIDAGGGKVYINSGPGVKPQDQKAAPIRTPKEIAEKPNPLYPTDLGTRGVL
jgi:hypothetical protein